MTIPQAVTRSVLVAFIIYELSPHPDPWRRLLSSWVVALLIFAICLDDRLK